MADVALEGYGEPGRIVVRGAALYGE